MCECEVCKYGRLVEVNLAYLPEPQRVFFEDMYERLCYAEEGISRFTAIHNGTWPYAKNILTHALSKCGQCDD